MNIFISLLHLNVVDQLRNAAEDKATKILREKLKFTTSAKSAGGKVGEISRERVVTECVMMFSNVGAVLGISGIRQVVVQQ